MKKLTSYFLIASLVINLGLGAYVINLLNGKEPVAQAFSEIKDAGTYGPKSVEVVDGDMTIKSADVVVQNTHVKGDLYLTKEIGDGSVNLLNVTVDGTTYVNGGGENSVYFENASLNELKVNKEQGAVRVVVRGKTDVKSTSVEGSAILATESLKEDALGFGQVTVKTEKKVDLNGQFGELQVQAKAQINVLQGSIKSLHIAAAGAASVINLSANTSVETGVIEGTTEVTGEGKFNAVTINAPGLTKLAGTFKSVSSKGKGVFIEVTKGAVESLTVEESESAASIHLAQEASVKSMILLGKAAVTGTGQIESVEIKSPGTSIDQTPGKVVLAKDITAQVGGKQLPDGEEANPGDSQPSQPSQPSTPTVSLGSISSLTIGLEQKGTRTISVTSGAKVTVVPSNGNVSAAVSGNTITLTGNKPGTAQITVKAEKQGYKSVTRTFTVTVDIIKSFTIKPGITPGKKLVIVQLYGSNPGSHSVTVGGETLTFMSSANVFRGEVNEGSASRSNVNVR